MAQARAHGKQIELLDSSIFAVSRVDQAVCQAPQDLHKRMNDAGIDPRHYIGQAWPLVDFEREKRTSKLRSASPNVRVWLGLAELLPTSSAHAPTDLNGNRTAANVGQRKQNGGNAGSDQSSGPTGRERPFALPCGRSDLRIGVDS